MGVNGSMVERTGGKREAIAVSAGDGRRELPRLRASELLQGGREAIIEHGDQEYRLRETARGKLILTK